MVRRGLNTAHTPSQHLFVIVVKQIDLDWKSSHDTLLVGGVDTELSVFVLTERHDVAVLGHHERVESTAAHLNNGHV